MTSGMQLEANEVKQIARDIRLLILDVDGVLTDGRLYYTESDSFKSFNAKDGLGMALLLKAGVEIALISGNQSSCVENRFEKLSLKYIFQGVKDKSVIYKTLLEKLSLDHKQVAYMGDDLIDLPVMTQVALATTPQDADAFVKTKAHWISRFSGGEGAVRELCELILDSKDRLLDMQSSFIAS